VQKYDEEDLDLKYKMSQIIEEAKNVIMCLNSQLEESI
jgi:hypothetical protein